MAADGAHILLVEDDAPSRRLLSMALRSEGYRVTDVGSGEAALTLLANEEADFQALVTDVMMPGIGGHRLLDHVHASPRWRLLPVLVVTGLASPPALDGDGHQGAIAYLSKPVHLSEFFAMIAGLLAGARVSR